MPRSEAQLESYFRKQVRQSGALTIKLAPTEKGVPDRMVLAPGGRVLLVELKTETGRLSAAQRLWHNRALAVGTTVHTVYGKRGVDALVTLMREDLL